MALDVSSRELSSGYYSSGHPQHGLRTLEALDVRSSRFLGMSASLFFSVLNLHAKQESCSASAQVNIG